MNDIDRRVTDGVRHLRLLMPDWGIVGHDRQQSALSQYCLSAVLILHQITCLRESYSNVTGSSTLSLMHSADSQDGLCHKIILSAKACRC